MDSIDGVMNSKGQLQLKSFTQHNTFNKTKKEVGRRGAESWERR